MTRSAHYLGDAVLGGGLRNNCVAYQPQPQSIKHQSSTHSFIRCLFVDRFYSAARCVGWYCHRFLSLVAVLLRTEGPEKATQFFRKQFRFFKREKVSASGWFAPMADVTIAAVGKFTWVADVFGR